MESMKVQDKYKALTWGSKLLIIYVYIEKINLVFQIKYAEVSFGDLYKYKLRGSDR